MENLEKKPEKKGLQNTIAIIITSCVIGITVVIAFFCLLPIARGEEANMDFLGQSLLPLWGTWIGTVLAFYFSKENFEAASKSYQDTIKKLTTEEKIASISVTQAMKKNIEFKVLDDKMRTQSLKKYLLDDKTMKHNHFIFFDEKNVLQYVILKTIINQYIVNNADTKNKIDDFTIEDIITTSDPAIQKALSLGHGYNFVSENANLLDVKKIMDTTPTCFDIFVTKNGRNNEPVLGLITDEMVFEQASV